MCGLEPIYQLILKLVDESIQEVNLRLRSRSPNTLAQ